MLIINGRVFLEDRVIENGYVLVEGTTIKSVGMMEHAPNFEGEVIDADGKNIIPGFIDQHIHGANGSDNMDATQEAVGTIAKFLPKEGTTSYCPTTMTQSVEAVDAALREIVAYKKTANRPGEADIVGIHLEGPFISPHHVGAQNPKFVMKPTIAAFDHFNEVAENMVKVVTYAPEEAEVGFTDHLRTVNVVPSAGHTDATYDQVVAEIDHGLCNLTHFHNAMTPHHHRKPGVVTAGFIHHELKAEMICDGIHLAPAVVKSTYEIKGANNCIAITDSMRAKGLPDGTYDLGGQEVTKIGKECRLSNGTLAGSVAEMDFVVRNIKEFTGADIHELIKMSSVNAAKQLGIFGRKGSIAINKDADLVICDNEINIDTTICRGVVGYQR